MARLSSEIIAGTFDLIGIAVAFGVGHGNRFGGDEFAERGAMAVGGDEAGFPIGNLQEVHANARQAEGLRRSGPPIVLRLPLQLQVIHAKKTWATDTRTT